MPTQRDADDRIALLQGTLDLLILKTLVLVTAMARALHGRTNACQERLFRRPWVTLPGPATKTRSGSAQSGENKRVPEADKAMELILSANAGPSSEEA